MKRIIRPFTLLLSAIFLCASCLDSDEAEYTYYDDTAISAFSISYFDQTLRTLSSQGEDSTYVKSTSGSAYKFYIDHYKCEIYNPDSLPRTADATRLLCSFSAKNSGLVLFKDIVKDSLVYYSDADSIDISVPREMRAYSNSGEHFRAYTVKVNVHKEDPDSFRWNLLCNAAPFAGMKNLKAVHNNGRVYVFGTDGTMTQIYYSDVEDGRNWTPAISNMNGAANMVFDADVYKNVAVKDGYIYIRCKGGQIFKSADASQWQPVAAEPSLEVLVGAGKHVLYGIGNGGMMFSEDDGATWKQDNIDDDAQWLPSRDISGTVAAVATNDDVQRLMMIGNRDANAFGADTTAVIWSRIEEAPGTTRNHPWVCHLQDEYNKYQLPRLESLAVFSYGGNLIAMGGKGIGNTKARAYSVVYTSEDNGLTWHNDKRFYYPDDFDRDAAAITILEDATSCMWIICGGTGQVWRGRLNSFGWEKPQTSFDK